MCRLRWCETPAEIHAEDTSYHTRELGYGMRLSVDNNGDPTVNWIPDWEEWWIEKPEDIDEFMDVTTMLASLKQEYTAFHDELVNDPKFAEEVAAMKAKDAAEVGR